MDFADKARYVELISSGESDADAAILCGYTPSAVRKAINEDRDFATEVTDAKALVIGDVEAALLARARHGNMDAIKFFLKNRAPDDWADEKIGPRGELQGKAGGPIQIAQATVIVVKDLLQSADTQHLVMRMLDGPIIDAEIVDE